MSVIDICLQHLKYLTYSSSGSVHSSRVSSTSSAALKRSGTMALIVFSGYPSSGKSRRAQELRNDFENRIRNGNSNSGGISEVLIVKDVEYDGRGVFDGEKIYRA